MNRREPAGLNLVLPARVVDPHRVLQTTASDLRESGAFVHTLSPPGEGVLLALGLYLPDGAEPLVISAVAGRAPEGSARRGFLAAFTPDAARARRLARMLDFARTTATPNLRTFGRVPTNFKVLVPSPGGVFIARVRDVGPSGMFVEMPDPPQRGTVLPVIVDLPDARPPAVVTVEIVRLQEAAPERPRGAGVQFIGADDEFRERLDALLRAESRHAHPDPAYPTF
jgi:hypothetical protein